MYKLTVAWDLLIIDAHENEYIPQSLHDLMYINIIWYNPLALDIVWNKNHLYVWEMYF